MSDAFDAIPLEICTLRLRLRAMRLEDAPAVHAYAFNPEVARFLPWRPYSSAQFAQGLVQVMIQPQFCTWAVVMPPADEPIGMVFLQARNEAHRKAEIAFNLARSHWGQGIMTEAARAVLDFAFQRLGLHRIEAAVMPGNLASRRVLEKLGMRFEGHMSESHRRYDGFHDMDLFALIAPSDSAPSATEQELQNAGAYR